MGQYDSMLAGAVSQMEALTGSTFFVQESGIQSHPFTGVFNEFSLDEKLALAGVEDEVSGQLVCSKTQFHNVWSPKRCRILLNSKPYRISEFKEDAICWTFTLAGINK